MRKLTNKEFNIVFDYIKENIYVNPVNNKGATALYATNDLVQFSHYNFTSKQLKKIYDWFLADKNDTIRLDALFSINDALEERESVRDYQYLLDKLVKIKISDFYYIFLYYHYHSYNDEEQKKEDPFIKLTFEYLEKLKFTNLDNLRYCIRQFNSRWQNREYKYHDYDFALLFNEELQLLIDAGMNINYDDFCMEDKLERYLSNE